MTNEPRNDQPNDRVPNGPELIDRVPNDRVPNEGDWSSSANSGPALGATSTSTSTRTLPPVGPPAVVAPVRRRNRPAIIIGLIAAALAGLLLALIAAIAIGVAVIVGIASGDISIDANRVEMDLTPATLSELPANIDEENAEIHIDLTELNTTELSADGAPVELDVQVEVGSIEIIVPDDLAVSVEATNDVGDVTVFGDSDDGFDNMVFNTADDADLAIALDLDVGQIEVRRG